VQEWGGGGEGDFYTCFLGSRRPVKRERAMTSVQKARGCVIILKKGGASLSFSSLLSIGRYKKLAVGDRILSPGTRSLRDGTFRDKPDQNPLLRLLILKKQFEDLNQEVLASSES
jgi:hypothetical protein